MEWFFVWVPSLRGRLYAIGLVMAVLMTALVLVLLQLMADQIGALKTVYEDRVVPLRQLKQIADAYAVQVVDASHKVRNQNLSWEEGARSVQQAQVLIQQEWQAYTATFLVDEEKRLIAKLLPLMRAADAAGAELAAILARKDEAALVEFTTRRLYPTFDPVSDAIGALVNLQIDVARGEYEGAVAAHELARLTAWGDWRCPCVWGWGLEPSSRGASALRWVPSRAPFAN
jgi:hypothetical protein